MSKYLTLSAVIMLSSPLMMTPPAMAQALKTAKACTEEYKAQKPTLKAAKEKKGDFISACRALPIGTSTPIGGAATSAPAPSTLPTAPFSRTSTVGSLKTSGACNDEYKANKGALKDAKEKKKDFVAACRALPPGTPTPIGSTAATPAQAPVSSPATTSSAPTKPYVPPSAAPASRSPAPSSSAAPTGANEFTNETGAKAHCPSATVVWVNTKSKIYHFAGTKNYGNTKAGAYMCESDATAAGDRASMTEKHP